MRAWGLVAAILLAAPEAWAGSKVVQYGPKPAWVLPPPPATGTAPPAGASNQVLYLDSQTRLGRGADEHFAAYRIKVLTAEALSLGNLTAAWNPETDDIFVHGLKVFRDGRAIDVLAKDKFKVIQRENGLEYAMLDGQLTAMLQAPGLQVGDEVEFAVTIRRRATTLGDRSAGVLQLPTVGAPGAYRQRLVWPKGKPLRWQAAPDLGKVEPQALGDDLVLTQELRDPATAITAEGAPERVNLRRYVQYSSFADWADVADTLRPLFEAGSRLAPNSPIRAEAAKIAAKSSDPAVRAAEALRLVQERIRYVYVGLGEGAYRPATADETWTRRFGDCKGKTVLLIALLRELGIAAEPALVHSDGGDGTDAFLPTLAAFDHVLVKASIGGRTYWLDGTRRGDVSLARLQPPTFRWALPLHAKAALQKVEPEPPLLAQATTVLEIDARGGFDAPAKVRVEQVFRGDIATGMRTSLLEAPKADADRFLRSYFMENLDWAEPESVSWRWNEAEGMTVLSMSGTGAPEWQGDDEQDRVLFIHANGFSKPAPFRRPAEQDQAAPWVTEFPDYMRWTTVVRLPEVAGWTWRHRADAMDVELGAVSYHREDELRDNILRLTSSKRTLKPEITAQEAAAANAKRADFDDTVPRVFLRKTLTDAESAARLAPVEAAAGEDADKLVAIAFAYLEFKRPDEARRVFDKVLAKNPAAVGATVGKARVLESAGDVDGALKVLKADGKAGADPETRIAHAQTLARAGRAEAAAAAYEAIYREHGTKPDVAARTANGLLDLGRRARAGELAAEGLRRTPADAWLLQIRAAASVAEGRWNDALADYEQAVRAAPEEPNHFRNRAVALRRLGRHDEALADLDEALRMSPEDGRTLHEKAVTLRAAGRGREALALSDELVARTRSANALNNRCWSRALAGVELAGAESDCAEAVKREPKSAGYWDSYALVALRRGQLDEAIRRYDHALSLAPKQAVSLYARGLTKLRKGDAAGGRADMAAGRALSPDVSREFDEAGLKP